VNVMDRGKDSSIKSNIKI